ncbi:PTS fructose transporter subunit IIC [Collinsella sp. AGMB00827]|uniref:PTS fructose transporter subunit IIC n=1 Tax=Collinsella ureilytica TaxID=2869515 RepID=A0ABS7MJH8_9ACTN|nr:PTS fructose transporter subunit IIC [Collinsella urealyticum]MBY4797183.1 PTS fructose transporter subunit IIC [Collinsella urealyticum]
MKDLFKRLNIKGHLLTAISYMIPVVCGAGFVIAIGMSMGGGAQDSLTIGEFSFWDCLATIGAKGLGMLPAIIATGIAFSIAGKPGIAPGFVTGMMAQAISAGFIGGMLGGYLAGWITLAALSYIKVPTWAKGLMPTLIVPFVGCLTSGLIMAYVIGAPVSAFTDWLTGVLTSMSGASNTVFGALIGGLSVIDFGGPINKTVYAFTLTLQAEGINGPVTALQLANTSVPIGFGFAYLVAKACKKNIFTKGEIENLESAVPMGIVNIVEGVIPIIMNNMARGIIASMCGGAAGGAVLMTFTQGAGATVPFGGFLMLPTMGGLWWAGLAAIATNVLVTGVVYALIHPHVTEEEAPANAEAEEEDLDLDSIVVM